MTPNASGLAAAIQRHTDDVSVATLSSSCSTRWLLESLHSRDAPSQGNTSATTAGRLEHSAAALAEHRSMQMAVPERGGIPAFVTVQNNLALGIYCSPMAVVTGIEVLTSGNTVADISSTCGFVSCATTSMTCGAQP